MLQDDIDVETITNFDPSPARKLKDKPNALSEMIWAFVDRGRAKFRTNNSRNTATFLDRPQLNELREKT